MLRRKALFSKNGISDSIVCMYGVGGDKETPLAVSAKMKTSFVTPVKNKTKTKTQKTNKKV